MPRRTAYLLLFTFLMALPGTSMTGRAQPANQETPFPVTPVEPPQPVSPQAISALFLTPRDNGQTFTVPVNSLIVVQIPRFAFSRLGYDPSILQLLNPEPYPIEGGDNLPPLLTPEPSGVAFPIAGWRLRAIQPGISPLSIDQEPCRKQPCPMMPVIAFQVTIVVSGPIYPTPAPPAPPVGPETYIGTAYLDQTVTVQPGAVIRLDLPSLPSQRRVQLQYDPMVLRPWPGQNLAYPQPGGWRFQVIGTGTTPLIVQAEPCGIDCPARILFRVTITTIP